MKSLSKRPKKARASNSMTWIYDDPSSTHYQNPHDLQELIALAPELPIFNEDLPFDNRSYIIPLYKPAGISSFDVIRSIRSQLIRFLGKGKGRRKLKIGHFGTLDPFAQGLLLVGSGKAMKLMNLIQEQLPKNYIAVGKIGIKTFTGDCDGDEMSRIKLESAELKNVYLALEEVIDSLKGEYWQRPPYFSAVKHEGRPLYEYAREGIFIEKPAVQRTIYELDLLENPTANVDEVSFSSKVSNGTYIRTLWQDMLKSIDGQGHLIKLVRNQIGKLSLEDSLTPEEFKARDELVAFSPDQVVSLESVYVTGQECIDLLQGRSLWGNYKLKEPIFWAFYKNNLIGLAEVISEHDGTQEIKIKTLLFGMDKRERSL